MNESQLTLLQTRRFNEQIEDILQKNFKIRLNFEKHILVNVKINYTGTLQGYQIEALQNIEISWNFEDINITRSGAGLKIEFTGGAALTNHQGGVLVGYPATSQIKSI